MYLSLIPLLVWSHVCRSRRSCFTWCSFPASTVPFIPSWPFLISRDRIAILKVSQRPHCVTTWWPWNSQATFSPSFWLAITFSILFPQPSPMGVSTSLFILQTSHKCWIWGFPIYRTLFRLSTPSLTTPFCKVKMFFIRPDFPHRHLWWWLFLLFCPYFSPQTSLRRIWFSALPRSVLHPPNFLIFMSSCSWWFLCLSLPPPPYERM